MLAERICLAVLDWWRWGLPTLTGSHARVARRIGIFGLVTGGITNPYQPAHADRLVVLVWSPPLVTHGKAPRIWL
jgi:hypothetical protein